MSASKRKAILINSQEFPILSQDGHWLIPNWSDHLYSKRGFSKTEGTVMLWYVGTPAYRHASQTMDTSWGPSCGCGFWIFFLSMVLFWFSRV